MSNHNIGPGEDFTLSIQHSIKKCSCFVLLLTKEAQESPWVIKELKKAISLNKPIVPIQPRPTALYDDFQFDLIDIQITELPVINIQNADTQHLINAVKGYMNGKPWKKRRATYHAPINKKAMGIAAIVIAAAVIIPFVFIFFHISSGLLSNITGNNLPTPSSSVINQIPDYFEDEVTALKYAGSLEKKVSTKTVKVGEHISLSTAWNNYVLYSEDTSIAIPEGTLIKGVSPGETYVVMAVSKDMTQVYYIIVEE